jgi:catechol 2,3-dioxygenase-like lactoylglutathione lyase family enzyme
MSTTEPIERVVTFEGCTPVLAVRDLRASIDYYVRVLGFHLDFEEAIASVSRGRCALFLSEGDQGTPGAWVWLGVSDVDALHAELEAAGALIRQPPTNFSWACEMQVADLDGNVLRFGSEPKEGVPYGPWRDMRGDFWVLGGDGRWRQETRG